MIRHYDTRQNQTPHFSVWHSQRQHDDISRPPTLTRISQFSLIYLRCSCNQTTPNFIMKVAEGEKMHLFANYLPILPYLLL